MLFAAFAAAEIYALCPLFFDMLKSKKAGGKDLSEHIIIDCLDNHEIGELDAIKLIQWSLRKDCELFPFPAQRGKLVCAMILESARQIRCYVSELLAFNKPAVAYTILAAFQPS
jgi:hypothetical protein